MRQSFLILTVFIFGCSASTRKESTADKDTASKLIASISRFDTIVSKQCEYENLSEEFNIKVSFDRHTKKEEIEDSCILTVYLIHKKNGYLIDSMQIYSTYLFSDVFSDCNNVLSYSTKHNVSKQVIDNYFGDLVVADLNFDHKEDIAIICDSGGNGGSLYNYYIQGSDHIFTLDKFLTDSMSFFPSKINPIKRTLTTYVHAGVCGLGEHIYKLDNKNRWTEKSHRIIDSCNE